MRNGRGAGRRSRTEFVITYMETAPRALMIAARLLESEDWKFSTRLEVGKDLYVHGADWLAEAFGSMVIDWEIDFDVRNWGIKDISVTVHRVEAALDLSESDDEGSLHTREHIDINWPQAGPPPESDSENPSAALARHMATPQWQVKWSRQRYDDEGTMIAVKEATVHVLKRTIDIEF